MSRADYAHWNEEQDRVWWEEEGKHSEEPPWEDPDFYNETMGAADAYAEELGEHDDEYLLSLMADTEYLRRWPAAKPLIQREIKFRGIEL